MTHAMGVPGSRTDLYLAFEVSMPPSAVNTRPTPAFYCMRGPRGSTSVNHSLTWLIVSKANRRTAPELLCTVRQFFDGDMRSGIRSSLYRNHDAVMEVCVHSSCCFCLSLLCDCRLWCKSPVVWLILRNAVSGFVAEWLGIQCTA